MSDAATFVYLNLFVSEFVVALDGNLNQLTDAPLQQLASAAPERRSTRPWRYHDGSKEPEVIALGRFYRRKLQQKGLGKARVAVARKLGIRLWILLRDQIDYDEFCRRALSPATR